MVRFFSFPFLNASVARSGNVRGQASGSRQQGAGGGLSCCLCLSGEIRAELNPLEPSPCLWVLDTSFSLLWSQGILSPGLLTCVVAGGMGGKSQQPPLGECQVGSVFPAMCAEHLRCAEDWAQMPAIWPGCCDGSNPISIPGNRGPEVSQLSPS